MLRIGLLYFRSLYSQSINSLTVDKIYSALKYKNVSVKQFLLMKENHYLNFKASNEMNDVDVIIYKVNYQDFEYGIRFIKGIAQKNDVAIILIGPFACLNKERIMEKYPFVTNVYSPMELNLYLSKLVKEPIDAIRCGAKYRQVDEIGRYANIEYSSGCIYKCSFCHIPLSGGVVFVRSAEDVVEEIEYLNEKYLKKYFIFNDSIFWKGKKDTKFINEFCNLIREKKLKVYFMIYLALGSNIPQDLLIRLKEAGLVRVFFGVENITDDFQSHNPKKVSRDLSEKFMDRLENLDISYHIGFMIFYPQLKFENILVNLNYLKEHNKMFRLGIIREKMRIIPNSTHSQLLFEKKDKVDQAYNYNFLDSRVDSIYEAYCSLIESISYRSFESFFTNLDLLNSMLCHDKKEGLIDDLIDSFADFKTDVNNRLYHIFENIYMGDDIEQNISILHDIYSDSEFYYLEYLNQIKIRSLEDYLANIPHGKEEANVPNLFIGG